MLHDNELERLRERYAGRRVTVDAQRPELARMAGRTGTVRGVNASGRALVQFEGPDRSWYDIAPDFLRLVEEGDAIATEEQA